MFISLFLRRGSVYKEYHQSKLILSHQVRNTFLLFGSAQFLEFWLSKLV